jgi:hypothetical protein
MRVSIYRPRTGTDLGLFEKSEAIQMLADGRLEPDDVAFGDGFKTWVPVYKLQPKSPSILLQASLSKANALAHQPSPTLSHVGSLASPPLTFWRCLTFLPRFLWRCCDVYYWIFTKLEPGWEYRPIWVSKVCGLVLTSLPVIVVLANIFAPNTPPDLRPTAPPSVAVQSAAEVVNSSWDGSVKQVKRWLEENANDPRSIEYISWGSVHKEPGGYWVQCKFRAKNGFGALIIQGMEFHLDNAGNVVKTLNL